jgi:ABC-type nitrate/sulfonate/bicarbonate transport system substrate-binding protein
LTIVQTKVYEERYDEIKKIVKTFFDSIEFYNTNTDKAYEDMMGVAGVTKEEMPDVMRGAKLLDLKDNLTSMTVQQDSNLYLAHSGQQKSDYLFSSKMTDKTFTADDIQQNIIAPKIVEELAAEAGVTAN